jgi:hypothetical protein
MSYVAVAPGSPEMLGALTRLAPIAPSTPITSIKPIVSLTRTQPLDLANRRPAVQPPAAPPGAALPRLPQSPEDAVLAKAFVEKLLAVVGNDLEPDEIQAVLLLTKGQILALVEEKERMKSSRAPIVRAAFEHALAVVASMASSGGTGTGDDAPAAKKFPIIPVAVGVAVLAFLLMRR